MNSFDLLEFFSAFIVLFAVIDILGSVPIVIDIRNKGGRINAFHAASISFSILLLFLFVGEALLGLFGVDLSSFAIAGAFVLMLMAMEMILGIRSEEHTSELQSRPHLVCRLLLEKKKKKKTNKIIKNIDNYRIMTTN